MADEQKQEQRMNVGEFLFLAKQIFEARPPMGAPLLFVDEACEAGGEPLEVVLSQEPPPLHLREAASAGALVFRVKRQRTVKLFDGFGLAVTP